MHSQVMLHYRLHKLPYNFKEGRISGSPKGLAYTGEWNRATGTWIQILALTCPICMTLSKVLNLSVPQFFDL